ncbi:SWIM zinc finger family protein [Haloplanus halophilus]|uniref:SWIM zinc finger family protein n=1 Tax=Haloplanus halophilus TaxID=2949993 RepID=UPI00203F51DA|nr:SWIM zinc finger family protein [Haloplanus sp. GDY1]
MSTDVSGSLERDLTTDRTDLEQRTRRALKQYLTVLDDIDEAAGADDLYVIISESGSQYCVDARDGSCTCPDAEHRDPEGGCKHVRRVAFAIGAEAIPTAADPDAVDDQLGAHVDGPVRWACEHGREFCAEAPVTREDAIRCSDCEIEAVATPAERVVADGGIIEAGDEGEILDEEDGRPDDCDCGDWNDGIGLPCWPCYREGFESPASAGEEGDR